MYKTKITSQGTISLPVALRSKYHLNPGDNLLIEDNGSILISKVPDLQTLREKNKKYAKRKVQYQTGDGFAAYVKEKYAKEK